MSLSEALLLDPYPLDVWIAVRTDGVKGSGTITDPYDGSSPDGISAAKFDGVMRQLPENIHVHLGPGVFLTNGYADGVSGGWQLKKGMRISGSGLGTLGVPGAQLPGITTLKLVGATDAIPNKHYFAIGHAPK